MELAQWYLLPIVAFFGALATFFTGFGLNTILVPVFLWYVDPALGVFFAGLVHLANNVLKVSITAKKIDWMLFRSFGLPALFGAALGAFLLIQIGGSYNGILKPIFGLLFMFFAILEFFNWRFSKFSTTQLNVGGFLSGFFGGLAGVQGALRSAFLIKAGLSKESFIATTVVVSTFVDITRLSVYTTRFDKAGLTDNMTLVICATLSAIVGAYIGNKLLKKVTLHFVKITVAVLLILISLGLGSGIL